MFAQFVEWLRQNVGKALTAMGLGSALLSATLTDLSGWRSSNRDFMKRQLEISEQADRELIPLIRKFSEKALGKGQTSDADLSSLRSKVDNSYLVATRIVERLPNAQPEAKTYVSSLTDLQKCAEKFQGPSDAKCWTEGVSTYAARKKAFDQKVAALQGTWP